MKVSSRKSKGAQFEYNIQDLLKEIYSDILLTKELGFQLQYDLVSNNSKIAIECKFHRSMTWNECVKLFNKLESKAPKGYNCFLIFKTNRQPVLVMYKISGKIYCISFEDLYGIKYKERCKK
jgi:hypothetical protein